MKHKFLKKTQLGFTMVELTLAMAFVGVLMLAIATTVIQIGNIYNKGITMQSVEQVGRLITTDIRRTIAQGSSGSLGNDDNCLYRTGNRIILCKELISESYYDYKKLVATNADTKNHIRGGRFCTGTYTYVWNYGGALNDGDSSQLNKYITGTGSKISFVRIPDSGASYCRQTVAAAAATATLDDIPFVKATDLLGGTDLKLAVHRVKITKVLGSNSQVIYKFNMRIGTNDTDYIPSGGECDTKKDAQIYCAVNEFEFTALNDIMGG